MPTKSVKLLSLALKVERRGAHKIKKGKTRTEVKQELANIKQELKED